MKREEMERMEKLVDELKELYDKKDRQLSIAKEAMKKTQMLQISAEHINKSPLSLLLMINKIIDEALKSITKGEPGK